VFSTRRFIARSRSKARRRTEKQKTPAGEIAPVPDLTKPDFGPLVRVSFHAMITRRPPLLQCQSFQGIDVCLAASAR